MFLWIPEAPIFSLEEDIKCIQICLECFGKRMDYYYWHDGSKQKVKSHITFEIHWKCFSSLSFGWFINYIIKRGKSLTHSDTFLWPILTGIRSNSHSSKKLLEDCFPQKIQSPDMYEGQSQMLIDSRHWGSFEIPAAQICNDLKKESSGKV